MDIKYLATSQSADSAFSTTMNVVFFILIFEFLAAIFFELDYIGRFFFYLDLIDALSLIPDTDLIMNLISSNPHQAGTEHLKEASAYSQAGAK